MKILNTHKRIINGNKSEISEILLSLSSKNDRLWPHEKWPAMIFTNGLRQGAEGGHGPIKYSVKDIVPGERIEFKFLKPDGYSGIHKFEIREIQENVTEVRHTISATLSGTAIISWFLAIKWLHDALLEDCLDKLENRYLAQPKKTSWSIWVVLLRELLKKL